MSHTHDMRGQLTDSNDAYKFLLAGNATFTLVSRKTGTRFTYKIEAGDGCHFVKLLNGPDNENDYRYLGRIHLNTFWAGRKVPKPGDISRDAPSMRAFIWFWNILTSDVDTLPDTLEVWHEARCGRCGRKLTVPESVARGFGPECAGKAI